MKLDKKYGEVVLLTGMAGFIGYHVAKRLSALGWFVIGLDNINDYYDVRLKYDRLANLGFEREEIGYGKLLRSKSPEYPGVSFIQMNLEDHEGLKHMFETYDIGYICNLAAQAGVRYSIENPLAYVNSNLLGFTNILEMGAKYSIKHVVYASSSSVYGLNGKMPFSEHDATNHPVSLYAATKKSNELMAHVYSNMYQLPVTGLRFFTVYGPYGRPDMSPMLFAKAIMNGEPIKVFNKGRMSRDFTYVDDVVEGVVRVLASPAKGNPDWNAESPDPASSKAPYRVYNIGSSSPVQLMRYIRTLEQALGKEAKMEMLPMQPGDVLKTYCDVGDLVREFAYRPKTKLKNGLAIFAEWYKVWHQKMQVINE